MDPVSNVQRSPLTQQVLQQNMFDTLKGCTQDRAVSKILLITAFVRLSMSYKATKCFPDCGIYYASMKYK